MFHISQPKQMLSVLKTTISMRWFFLPPKSYVKTDRLKKIQFYSRTFCLYRPEAPGQSCITPDRGQSKTLLTIDEHRSKSPETVFSMAICHQLGDKWRLKTLFLTIFYLI